VVEVWFDESDVGTAHINNLYNTTFWALVLQGGQSTTEANQTLSVSKDRLSWSKCLVTDLSRQGTVSGDKNEILFKQFGINYSTLPEHFRRGSTIVRREVELVRGDVLVRER
jgi:tRNA(His) guanylyltransferase